MPVALNYSPHGVLVTENLSSFPQYAHKRCGNMQSKLNVMMCTWPQIILFSRLLDKLVRLSCCWDSVLYSIFLQEEQGGWKKHGPVASSHLKWKSSNITKQEDISYRDSHTNTLFCTYWNIELYDEMYTSMPLRWWILWSTIHDLNSIVNGQSFLRNWYTTPFCKRWRYCKVMSN